MLKKYLLLTIILVISGCKKNETMPAEIEYVPTLGEKVIIQAPVEENDRVRHTVEIFPKEIYFGDTIYFIAYDENLSEEMIPRFTNLSARDLDGHMYGFSATLSCDTTSKTYTSIAELRTNLHLRMSFPFKDFQPGEKRIFRKAYIELPPLEDWEDPFWKDIRDKMPPEGIKLTLSVKHARFIEETQPRAVAISEEILIKPRPASEMALLQKWYENTPEKLFPKVEGNRKVPHDMDLKSSGKSNIKVAGKRYDPWMFIRLGNRKPSDPNNPTTLAEWRKLESGLVPSTMRDEIRFTRLQLEYYDAEKGAKTDNAKTELVDWLKSLPEVQRNVMISSLVSNQSRFLKTALEEKNRELLRSLHDQMDLGCQERAYYTDRTLPAPKCVKIIRPFMEVVEPTAEDLALGSKDLPDGFRIWDATGDVGPTRMVAKYVELKENEDTLVLKNREGLSFNLVFSALNEDDKQHARELSQTVENPQGQ